MRQRATSDEVTTRPAGWRDAVARLAPQDTLCLGYHAYMLLRVSLAPDSPDARSARLIAWLLLALSLTIIGVARLRLLPRGMATSVVYRGGVLASVLLSYFELARLLPALCPTLLDGALIRIDGWLFGVTPAVALQRFNQRGAVEYFSFFYFSYYGLLALMLAPTLFLSRQWRARELQAGAMLVACVGHATYTVVPGLGPYAAIDFAAPLDGGFFWQLVRGAVAQGGAQLDIFPSLHTAYPTFFALAAIRWRREPPFRVIWPLITVWALNIIASTMFLRWHYGVDVIAGVALAIAALRWSERVTSCGWGSGAR